MREWYRDIMVGLAVLFGAAQAYFAARGPLPSDPPAIQTAAAHPIGGLIVFAILFLVAGVLNSAPLLSRLLPRKQKNGNIGTPETDWKYFYEKANKDYLEANRDRAEFREKYAECANEREQLKRELEELKKTQKPLPAHPLPRLREKIVLMCTELQTFLGKHGDKVRTKRRPEDSADQHLARLSSPELKEARVKFSGEYNRLYFQKVMDLQNEIKQFAGIIDHDLERSINLSKIGADSADCLEDAIKKFWEIALNVNC